jgi:hypothetical protein
VENCRLLCIARLTNLSACRDSWSKCLLSVVTNTYRTLVDGVRACEVDGIVVSAKETIRPHAARLAEGVGRPPRPGVSTRTVERVLLIAFARHEASDNRESW